VPNLAVACSLFRDPAGSAAANRAWADPPEGLPFAL